VIENGMLATTFEGYGLGNAVFASGPDGRWEFPVAAERPYSYARAGWAPSGLKGFYTWNPTTGAYTPVTDFLSQGSTTSYNVPGSEEFNADNPVDFIIASNEDPTA
jgi:hypothetical protein